ncbi:Expansin-A7 [Carex littledalei]|uniref:Expansin n=1 Tax=Carex littledalei TaxID=544730 RepID=A0A833QMS1_9POAL|nr:Expansin-A7 [Carex littledalei]
MVAMVSFSPCHAVVVAVVSLMMATAEAYFQPSAWTPAHATFYGDESGVGDDMGGACGYSNMYGIGFGTKTAALSTPLFNNGKGCGGCYEIRCDGSRFCIPGASSIVVTGTNLCPPNWALDSNNGGWCNPPRKHFDMAMPAWLSFARYEGGIVPVMYRRVPCKRTGGIKFKFSGNAYWLLVTPLNVAGAGDIGAMSIKGSKTDWIQMSQNWGVMWQAFSNLGGQALSFQIWAGSSSDTIICNNVADAYWGVGLTYQAYNNF